MKCVYVAWVGNADLKFAGGPEHPAGPTWRALEARSPAYDRVVLLGDVKPGDADGRRHRCKAYRAALIDTLLLKARTVDLRTPELDDPTDLGAVYHVLRHVVDEISTASGNTRFVFNMSGGTPAMSTAMLLLAATRPGIDLIQTSRESGVQPVEVPFDISVAAVREVAAAFTGQRPRAGRDLAEALDGIVRTAGGAMDAAVEHALRIAAVDVPVVIHGETGTGKELIARLIHLASRRSDGPFVAVNAGALPEDLVESALFGHERGAFTGADKAHAGHFEQADKGTLFLDEVADLSPSTQVKLLRALQEGVVRRLGSEKERRVDVRIVAASHKAMPVEVAEGRFRADLMYRLLVGRVRLPALRDRGADFDLLLDHVLDGINRSCDGLPGFPASLTDEARRRLRHHPWPGNIRELASTLYRAALTPRTEGRITPGAIEAELLPSGAGDLDPDRLPLDRPIDKKAYFARIERRLFERALARADGVQRQAAELLGVKPQAFNKALKRLGLTG